MNKYLLWKSYRVTLLFKTSYWLPFRIKAKPLWWPGRVSPAPLSVFPLPLETLDLFLLFPMG